MEPPNVEEVIEQIKSLPRESQRRVAEFARTLGQAPQSGVAGQRLLRFAGVIPPDDLRLMSEGIDQTYAR